jgi:hypothetical protein
MKIFFLVHRRRSNPHLLVSRAGTLTSGKAPVRQTRRCGFDLRRWTKKKKNSFVFVYSKIFSISVDVAAFIFEIRALETTNEEREKVTLKIGNLKSACRKILIVIVIVLPCALHFNRTNLSSQVINEESDGGQI